MNNTFKRFLQGCGVGVLIAAILFALQLIQNSLASGAAYRVFLVFVGIFFLISCIIIPWLIYRVVKRSTTKPILSGIIFGSTVAATFCILALLVDAYTFNSRQIDPIAQTFFRLAMIGGSVGYIIILPFFAWLGKRDGDTGNRKGLICLLIIGFAVPLLLLLGHIYQGWQRDVEFNKNLDQVKLEYKIAAKAIAGIRSGDMNACETLAKAPDETPSESKYYCETVRAVHDKDVEACSRPEASARISIRVCQRVQEMFMSDKINDIMCGVYSSYEDINNCHLLLGLATGNESICAQGEEVSVGSRWFCKAYLKGEYELYVAPAGN